MKTSKTSLFLIAKLSLLPILYFLICYIGYVASKVYLHFSSPCKDLIFNFGISFKDFQTGLSVCTILLFISILVWLMSLILYNTHDFENSIHN